MLLMMMLAVWIVLLKAQKVEKVYVKIDRN